MCPVHTQPRLLHIRKFRDSNAPLYEESTEVDQELVLNSQVQNLKDTPESSYIEHNAYGDSNKRLYHSEGALGPEKVCLKTTCEQSSTLDS